MIYTWCPTFIADSKSVSRNEEQRLCLTSSKWTYHVERLNFHRCGPRVCLYTDEDVGGTRVEIAAGPMPGQRFTLARHWADIGPVISRATGKGGGGSGVHLPSAFQLSPKPRRLWWNPRPSTTAAAGMFDTWRGVGVFEEELTPHPPPLPTGI